MFEWTLNMPRQRSFALFAISKTDFDISSDKNFAYELPRNSPTDLRLRILGRRVSKNDCLHRLVSIFFSANKCLPTNGQNLLKSKYQCFLVFPILLVFFTFLNIYDFQKFKIIYLKILEHSQKKVVQLQFY